MSLMQRRDRLSLRKIPIIHKHSYNLLNTLWIHRGDLPSTFARAIRESLAIMVPNLSSYKRYSISDLILDRYCIASFYDNIDGRTVYTVFAYDILAEKLTTLIENKHVEYVMYCKIDINKVTGDIVSSKN